MARWLILLVITSIVGFASPTAANANAPMPKQRGLPEGGDPGPQEVGLFKNLISKDVSYVWQATEVYLAPNPEKFFPDDVEAGQKLDGYFWRAVPERKPDREILTLVRLGLQRTRADRMPILRWVGNTYIWGVATQDPDAIELMYHAVEFGGQARQHWETRHAAVYFGLSVVQKKTPAILRTLVDLCLQVDDPNDLDRVAWGIATQRDEILELLRPHLTSVDVLIREKAEVLERMFKGELKAFDWAADQARKQALEKYGDQFPQFKAQLTNGSTDQRHQLLQKIIAEQIFWAMDDSFLPAFAKSAEDPNPKVRNSATIVAGGYWIWWRTEQHPDAVKLMLRMSKDADRDVRYNAVYYGLSTVREKDDAVIERLIELACDDRQSDLSRIQWGLSGDRERTKSILLKLLGGSDLHRAEQVRERYKELTGEEPPAKK